MSYAFHPSRRGIDVTVLTVLSVFVLYFTARPALVPRDLAEGVAVVFAPWTTPQAAMERTVKAGARFVRFGGVGFVTVAVPDGREYAAQAFAQGAWLVVDPKAVSACLSPFGMADRS